MLAGIVGVIWVSKNRDESDNPDAKCHESFSKLACMHAWYLMDKRKANILRVLAFLGTWVIVFTNFVPISLNISLDLIKLS